MVLQRNRDPLVIAPCYLPDVASGEILFHLQLVRKEVGCAVVANFNATPLATFWRPP